MTTQTPSVKGPGRGAVVGSPSRARFRNQRALAILSVVALFGIIIWLGLASLAAVPDVVPASASPLVFSAERAMTDLRVLTAAPRPVQPPRGARSPTTGSISSSTTATTSTNTPTPR